MSDTNPSSFGDVGPDDFGGSDADSHFTSQERITPVLGDGEQEPVSKCAGCQHYARASMQTLEDPGTEAECDHPEHGRLLTATMRRSVVQNCRSFSPLAAPRR